MARASVPISVEERRRPGRGSRIARLRADVWAPPLAAAALSFLPLIPVLKLWRADLRMPFTGYASDATLTLALIKGVLEHGWFLENSTLARPFGLQLYDFAIFEGDNLNFLLLKLLGVISSDPVVVVNSFALLTFPLTALAAFFAFRRLDVATPNAVVCAALFALLPYHFVRVLNGHVFLAAYWAVPLGAYLVLAVLGGDAIFERRSGRLPWALASRTTLVTLVLCVVIASSGIYYAVFTVLLLAIVGPLRAATQRGWGPLLTSGALIGLIGGVLLVNLSPTLVYQLVNGANDAVGKRGPQESEAFSLKPAQLVLPLPDHRVDRLARARARYDSTAPAPADYGVGLGIIGTVGFVTLVVALLSAGLGVRGPPRWAERLQQASVPTMVTLLTITVGGLSSLIAYALTPQLRGWYRLAIFIGFFGLLAVGLMLNALRSRFADTPLRRALYVGALGAILVVGVLDQTTPQFVPNYGSLEREFRTDRDFVRTIERHLPAGSDVFELPYASFPETMVNRMDAYDGARGYIHSERLRWSWGAMRGRPEDWPAELADEPPELTAAAVAAAGFEGVWVDRFGYADSGAAVERRLAALLGRTAVVSSDGRFSFFDIRSLARCERSSYPGPRITELATATLRPLAVEWASGFWQLEQADGVAWRWADKRAELVVRNRTDRPRRLLLSTTVHTGAATKSRLWISYPDGRREQLTVSSEPIHLDRSVAVRPGTHRLVFSTDAPRVANDPRSIRISFVGSDASELALATTERAVTAPASRRNPCGIRGRRSVR